MRVAVVDIGTNSTRLLVADVHPDGTLDELERITTITRLGQGVDASGALADEAMQRVFDTLARYRAAMDEHGVTETTAVLTSAVRDATNGAAFTARVRDDFGLEARTLSGDEEAQLSFLGATSSRRPDARARSSSSTSAAARRSSWWGARRRRVLRLHPGRLGAPGGALRPPDPPAREELAAVADEVRERFLAGVPADVRAGVRAAVAVAGTATQLAAIDQELEPYDPARVHGYRLDRAACERMLAMLAQLPEAERRAVPGLDPARAPTIVVGAVLMLEAMRAFDLDEVEVSEHDILRGAALRRGGA